MRKSADPAPQQDTGGAPDALNSRAARINQTLAEIAYAGFMRGDRTVVTGAMNKALVWARRILTESAQAKLNEKFYEEVPPEERKRHRGDFELAAAGKH